MRVWKSALCLAIGLSGCSTFHQAEDMNNNASADISSAQAQYPKIVNVTQAPYLMGAEVQAAAPLNPILSEPVTLVSAEPMSIFQVAGMITSITGLPVDVTGLLTSQESSAGLSAGGAEAMRGGLPPPPTAMMADSLNEGEGEAEPPSIRLHYHGSLGGLINTITAQTGFASKFQDGNLVFFKTETKTFLIPALAGAVTTSNEIVANSNSSSSGSSTGGSSGGSSNSLSGGTDVANISKTDVWAGVEKMAKAVANGAEVLVDSSTGMITVTGTPAQLDQVAAWVQSLSQTLSQQVAITIHIYSVKLNNEQNYGIQSAFDYKNIANQLKFSMKSAPAPEVSSGASPFSFGAHIISGRFNGSELAVQALATLGKVSQVFSQSRVTLNGQPASIQVAEQTGYLASVQTTNTLNVGTSASLTPGTITTGFTGTITPRVVDGKIYLGMNMVISSLKNLLTVTSGDSSIQVPTTDDTVVSQSAVLRSGSTLMITGYNEADGSSTHNGVGSPYFPLLGGGADATVGRDLIAIVVTAQILGGS